MSEEDVIRNAVAAWNEHGVDAFLEHVAPGVEWRHPPGFPQGDVWLGRDELSREMHDQFDELYDPGTVAVKSIERRADGWLIAARHITRARASGMELKWAAWYVWTIEDGLITRSLIFLDREEAEREAGVAG
jgi:ketosteroid isomerase-like protein